MFSFSMSALRLQSSDPLVLPDNICSCQILWQQKSAKISFLLVFSEPTPRKPCPFICHKKLQHHACLYASNISLYEQTDCWRHRAPNQGEVYGQNKLEMALWVRENANIAYMRHYAPICGNKWRMAIPRTTASVL